MTQPFATRFAVEVAEDSTATLSGQFQDASGANIPLIALVAVTLTLYDKATGEILNGREGLDIRDTGPATITADGFLELTLDPADNVVLDQENPTETHAALIEWTYNQGDAKGKALAYFTVRNLDLLPRS